MRDGFCLILRALPTRTVEYRAAAAVLFHTGLGRGRVYITCVRLCKARCCTRHDGWGYTVRVCVCLTGKRVLAMRFVGCVVFSLTLRALAFLFGVRNDVLGA